MSQTFTAEELAAEEWRPVVGFAADLYEVSSLGRARSWHAVNQHTPRPRDPRILSPRPDKDGYQILTLRSCGVIRHRKLHQLVLEAFVGERPRGALCRHFPDPRKTNNRIANLQWGSTADNSADAAIHGSLATGARHGTHTCPESKSTGEQHYLSKLTDASVVLDRWLRHEHGVSWGALGQWFGVHKQTIKSAVVGVSWKTVPYGLAEVR